VGRAPIVAGVFSELTARYLEERGAYRDLERTCPPEDVEALMGDMGWPVFEAALSFEQRFGGLVPNDYTVYGICNTLRNDEIWSTCEVDDEEPHLVPISLVADHACYIDPLGQIWRHDMIAARPVLFAPSFEVLIERDTARGDWLHPGDIHRLWVGEEVGEAVAVALGIARFDAASDDYETWWADRTIGLREGRSLVDGSDAPRRTEVYARGDAVLSAAARAIAAAHGPLTVVCPWPSTAALAGDAGLHVQGSTH